MRVFPEFLKTRSGGRLDDSSENNSETGGRNFSLSMSEEDCPSLSRTDTWDNITLFPPVVELEPAEQKRGAGRNIPNLKNLQTTSKSKSSHVPVKNTMTLRFRAPERIIPKKTCRCEFLEEKIESMQKHFEERIDEIGEMIRDTEIERMRASIMKIEKWMNNGGSVHGENATLRNADQRLEEYMPLDPQKKAVLPGFQPELYHVPLALPSESSQSDVQNAEETMEEILQKELDSNPDFITREETKEGDDSDEMTPARFSKFFARDLNTIQVHKLEETFAHIPENLKDEILAKSMTDRRIDAISIFCGVDRDTSEYYLRKHSFNPEAVVDDIDRKKALKFDSVWWLATLILLGLLGYGVVYDLLIGYLDRSGNTLSSISFRELAQSPAPLPVIILTVVGMDPDELATYSIFMKKATDESAEEHQLCGPKRFAEDCWSNNEDALVCNNGDSNYVSDSDFTWAMCRQPNVTRSLCPVSDPIMCANLQANRGIEPVCELHEVCAIKTHGGPRLCPDGRNTASLNVLPTSCASERVGNTLIDWEDIRSSGEPRIFHFETMVVIFPPNETITHTRDEYYVSFRVLVGESESHDARKDFSYATRVKLYSLSEVFESGVATWNDMTNFFYNDIDVTINEMKGGSKLTANAIPSISINENGRETANLLLTPSVQDEFFLWYHSAISYRSGSSKIPVTEEVPEVSFLGDFLGPAGGFISLLLSVHNAFLLMVLTGFTVPIINKKFFGWSVGHFDKEFRTKLLLFSKIYDGKVADATEGMDLLTARAVMWPTNERPSTLDSEHSMPLTEEGSSADSEVSDISLRLDSRGNYKTWRAIDNRKDKSPDGKRVRFHLDV